MLLGGPRTGPGAATLPARPPLGAAAALLLGLPVCAAIGIGLGPLHGLLLDAAAVLGAR
jgi:hydrogenase-4 component F